MTHRRASILRGSRLQACLQFDKILLDVLPLATPTRIYMSGSVRSWIHYINLRSANGTQKEHMDIANACKKLFVEQFPVVSEALEWA